MMMSKIVHFGKYYPPDAGGIESVTSSLAQGAANAGHDVSVVCFKKSAADETSVVNGVRIVRLPIGKMVASQPLGLRYLLACLKAARSADLVHLHVPNMLGALGALLIGRKPRLLVHWHADVINKGVLGRLLRPLEVALLKRADCIVATSQVYAHASPLLSRFESKVTVVPIGVTDARKQAGAPSEEPVAEATVPADLSRKLAGRKVILAVGRLVPYKGFDVLIEAAGRLCDDAVVVIVGGGPLQASLDAAIRAAGVADRVILAGRLSDEALHALFGAASLYCLPSVTRAEAFGVVLLEAMAYGLPIVATNIPGSGVPWVNKQGVSGINVPINDAGALAEACNRILNSDQDRRRFSEGARQRFMTEFTEEVSVKRMMAAYERLVV
ncbi:rhamnosyl/mannosyltransferase [Ralstonia sp. 25mfcol4.1]|uniref:glycosyltransferase n=1 Tax=Ralstonia sp. 25mfcol4.1 TaxID=1761899 RepID=UPI000882F094|nr:glycosyltransferase [Ralstonia sp. 25mfcol4.1]SDP57265.1 rhamnosyl/mannosyltransferase [Ralstonia sp. 25mfcol4.1]